MPAGNYAYMVERRALKRLIGPNSIDVTTCTVFADPRRTGGVPARRHSDVAGIGYRSRGVAHDGDVSRATVCIRSITSRSAPRRVRNFVADPVRTVGVRPPTALVNGGPIGASSDRRGAVRGG